MQSEQMNELATALSKAQAEIRNAEEDKNNPHFKSKYATLTSLWDACRGPLTKNGLSVVQIFDDSENKLRLVTILMHSSGQWIKSTFPIIQSIKIQETGSATTYARRYSLSSIVGIAPGDNDDDDGEKAMERDVKPIDNIVKPESPEHVKPEVKFASDAEIKTLLELVKKCPVERQTNFEDLKQKNIDKYGKMTAKFCEINTLSALKYLTDEEKNDARAIS